MQCLQFIANWAEATAELKVKEGENLEEEVRLETVPFLRNQLVVQSLKFFGIEKIEGQALLLSYNHTNDLECLVGSIETLINKLGLSESIFTARTIKKEGIEGELYIESFSMNDINLDKLGKAPFYKHGQEEYDNSGELNLYNKRPKRRY